MVTKNAIEPRQTELMEIGQETWDRLLPNRAEDFDYFRACAEAVPPGFEFGARAVYLKERIVAVAPTFTARYPVELRALTIPARIFGVGSPLSDDCPIGIAHELDVATRASALDALIGAKKDARRPLDFLVLKDVADAKNAVLEAVARSADFSIVPTLPRAVFDVDFATLPDYLQRLDGNTRRYLRHAERRVGSVAIERHSSINEDQSRQLHELYCQQQRAAAVDSGIFDGLSPTFFYRIMANKPEGTLLLTYRVEGELAGFSLSLFNNYELVPKYVGFRQPAGRQHRLYFINWLRLVEFSLGRGIKQITAGQYSYPTKVKLGCRLERNCVYFRHPNAFGNAITRAASRFIKFDEMDSDLAELERNSAIDLYAATPGAAGQMRTD